MSRMKTMLQHFENNRDWVEERVASGIENYRKTYGILTVTDRDGKPISGVKVRYNLTQHSFLHGAHCFMLDELETPEKNDKFKEYLIDVANHATLPFFWADLEPEPGKLRFDKDSPKRYRRPPIDLCMEFCEAHHIVPRLHCLNYDQWTPGWVDPHNIPEIKRLLEKRIREIAEKYGGRIHAMEVINETLIGPVFQDFRHSTDFFWESDFITWSFKTARKYLPDNELLINECTPICWDITRKMRSPYAQTIDNSIQHGAEIDAIAMQFHMFNRRENEESQSLPFFDPKRLCDVMDFYWENFRKPLQICEITLPCYSCDSEDEELQAKLIENLYPIWFSHPAVEMIMYWNLVDGYAAFAPLGAMDQGENYYHSGLLRFDLTPKPGYEMLKDMFDHRWHTTGNTETNGEGIACFRGFRGTYDIVLEKAGTKKKQTVVLDGENKTVILE